MGACVGKCVGGERDEGGGGGRGSGRGPGRGSGRASARESREASQLRHQRLSTVGLDVADLITETLSVIRTLVNNDQEPPASMLKLNLIADKEQGWLLIVEAMVDMVPADNPLGPAVITLFLDESPLPTKETVGKLLFLLRLEAPETLAARPSVWHRNVAIVLGCIAEKLAGPNSVATFRPSTLDYLLACLRPSHPPFQILFALIALEKYAQTSENKGTINGRLLEMAERSGVHPLAVLEGWLEEGEATAGQRRDPLYWERRQVGFCAQWSLDNLFVVPGREASYLAAEAAVGELGAMLNHQDVSEYLKMSPLGLEARCDVSSFESVRCTFEASGDGLWYYEAEVVTPGVMQIGWATKDSKFLNHEGYGIGDDEFSVAYDGCRQLVWHDAASTAHAQAPWRPGDVLGSSLDASTGRVEFALNGAALPAALLPKRLPVHAGYFAAASFMSFQQCRFNFGHRPFRFAPPGLLPGQRLRSFQTEGRLDAAQRTILPRPRKLAALRADSVPADSCSICVERTAAFCLRPCGHSGFCHSCALQLHLCPLCRAPVALREATEPASSSPTAAPIGPASSASPTRLTDLEPS